MPNGLKNLEIQVISEIKSNLAQLELALEQLALHRSNALLARKYRNMVEKKYTIGSGSLVMLNAAQLDLVGAQNRLALSLVSKKLAQHNLDTSTGKTVSSNCD